MTKIAQKQSRVASKLAIRGEFAAKQAGKPLKEIGYWYVGVVETHTGNDEET